MLDVRYENGVAIIDVRERILRGEHPRKEIVDFAQSAPAGTVVEVHLPLRAEPLVSALGAIGIQAVLNELEPGHFRLMFVKM